MYQNPFGFSLTAVKAGGEFIINYGGVDAAVLNLPLAAVLSAGTSNANLVSIIDHSVSFFFASS